MISVDIAESEDDRGSAVTFFRKLAMWDATESEAHGVPAELIMEVFHTHDADPTAKYRATGARLLLAKVNGQTAGCVAFDAFDPETIELHRLFVDPAFRGNGVGRVLVERALLEAVEARQTRVLIQTATFMQTAVDLYRSLGFEPCQPFRSSLPEIAHLEVFLAKTLSE